MATETIIKITDDLDGSDGASTVEFALEGVSYSIDLNDKNKVKLEKALAPFIEVASVVNKGRVKKAVPAYNANEVRAWASANNIEVSERGRIRKAVVDAYLEANSK